MKPKKSRQSSVLRSPITRSRIPQQALKAHVDRIRTELKESGALWYDLLLPETYYLPAVIHSDEHIKGSVFGRYTYRDTAGRGALIATDQRVIFLDKKPLFVHYDEINFMIIGSVTYTHTAVVGYVTLHTRLGDFQLRTFNQRNAYNFCEYIEEKCLQQTEGEKRDFVT
jgi:hypothetical protein